MDAGFASGGTFDTFEELNIDFLARIRNNPVLNRMAEPHLERPGDLAADEVRTVFHEATYRAANWSRARRVVLVVIHRHRELFPRHFWLITSLSRQAFDAEALLKRYRVRGKAENTFGELKTGLNPQLSSSARPKSHFRGRPLERETEPAAEEWRPHNEAILLLNLLAFQLMHEGRCGMETAEGQGWSIGKFREQGAPRRLPGRLARPDDDLPHRPIRRRGLVEAAGSLETVHSPDGVAVARPPQRPSPPS